MKIPDFSSAGNLMTVFSRTPPEHLPAFLDDEVRSLPLDQTNVDTLPTNGFQETRETLAATTNVAIAGINNAFTKPGITIVIVGESHLYKNHSPMIGVVLGMAKKMDFDDAVEMYIADKPWADPDNVRDPVLKKKFQKVHTLFMAEVEMMPDSLRDKTRAEALLLLAKGGQHLNPDLTILERGMIYEVEDFGGMLTTEEKILGPSASEGVGIKERSVGLAAWLFLCLAGGNQAGNDRVLIFIGEDHKDIFDVFETLVQQSKVVTWLKKRRRNYVLVPSHVVG